MVRVCVTVTPQLEAQSLCATRHSTGCMIVAHTHMHLHSIHAPSHSLTSSLTCQTHQTHSLIRSDKTPLLTCCLEGPVGSGKSAMAATVAIESEFPFVKVISPESLVGYAEQVGVCLCLYLCSLRLGWLLFLFCLGFLPLSTFC